MNCANCNKPADSGQTYCYRCKCRTCSKQAIKSGVHCTDCYNYFTTNCHRCKAEKTKDRQFYGMACVTCDKAAYVEANKYVARSTKSESADYSKREGKGHLSSYQTCRVCNGLSATKCYFCGQKRIKITDMTNEERLEYQSHKAYIDELRLTFGKLRRYKMKTTGCAKTDSEILLHIGDWHPITECPICGDKPGTRYSLCKKCATNSPCNRCFQRGNEKSELVCVCVDCPANKKK